MEIVLIIQLHLIKMDIPRFQQVNFLHVFMHVSLLTVQGAMFLGQLIVFLPQKHHTICTRKGLFHSPGSSLQ